MAKWRCSLAAWAPVQLNSKKSEMNIVKQNKTRKDTVKHWHCISNSSMANKQQNMLQIQMLQIHFVCIFSNGQIQLKCKCHCTRTAATMGKLIQEQNTTGSLFFIFSWINIFQRHLLSLFPFSCIVPFYLSNVNGIVSWFAVCAIRLWVDVSFSLYSSCGSILPLILLLQCVTAQHSRRNDSIKIMYCAFVINTCI